MGNEIDPEHRLVVDLQPVCGICCAAISNIQCIDRLTLQRSPAEGKAVQEDKVGAYCPGGTDIRLECGRRRRRMSAAATPTPKAKNIARAANLPPGLSRRRDHTGVDSPGRARRKATTLSPIEVPASECPPAAMTTYPPWNGALWRRQPRHPPWMPPRDNLDLRPYLSDSGFGLNLGSLVESTAARVGLVQQPMES